jgi:hypothetical protein
VENAEYFLEKAAQCRRLAASIDDEKASEALLKLAEEFEAKAAAYVARERAAHAIGLGDDVMPVQPQTPKGRKNNNRKKKMNDADG